MGNISGYAFLIHQIVIKGIRTFVSSKIVIAVVVFAVTVICIEIFICFEKMVQTLFPYNMIFKRKVKG